MSVWVRMRRAVWYVARGAVTSVIGNVSLAVLSVALALVLWLYVTERENPTEERFFNRAITVSFVNVPDDLALANASLSSVRVQVEGPEDELADLSVDDFEATADLGGLASGDAEAVVDVRLSNDRVNVTTVQPATARVTLEELRSKEVPVRVSLVGSPQQGFDITDQQVSPERTTISGPQSLVERVDSAVAEVVITGLRVDFTDERVALHPRDARGGEISRVSVEPETARVEVDLEQREFSQGFLVNPTVSGEPAEGYNVTGVSVEPRLVLVIATIDVLQSIDAVRGIPTDEVSVADARGEVSRAVRLVLPAGARAEGVTTVEVRVGVAAAQGQFSFSIVPEILNLGPGLVATPAEAVIVTLAGEVPLLRNLTPESIVVTVDAGALAAGVYSLPLRVQPPEGTIILRVAPEQLGIALTPAP
ncbi:MAG: CdaR family protein [Dehalococcoidia bacterium]